MPCSTPSIMFTANDSLIHLRNAASSEQKQKKRRRLSPSLLLPIDELRAKIARKQAQQLQDAAMTSSNKSSMRLISSLSSFSSSSSSSLPLPEPVASPPLTPHTTKIRIDETRNTVHIIPAISSQHSKDLWMTHEENQAIKDQIQKVLHLRSSHEIRGLEIHMCPELLQEKIHRNRNYMEVILQQQQLLKSLNPNTQSTTLPLMLSRLCTALSAQDTRDARQHGLQDAEEAFLIHAAERNDVDPIKLAALMEKPKSNNTTTTCTNPDETTIIEHEKRSQLTATNDITA